MRLAYFYDHPDGFGQYPPDTLADMDRLENMLDAHRGC
jgi:hypothetical protein